MRYEQLNWFIGPHLIGVVFMIVGFIMKAWPPKQMNKYYGYRMPSAMKSQAAWDEANRYSARIMLKTGLILLIIGVLFAVVMGMVTMPDRIRFAVTYLLILASAMGGPIAMIVSTERHLDRTIEHQE